MHVPCSFYSGQPFLPDFIKFHGGAHVPQAVFGYVTEFAFGHEMVHVHAGDAVTFGRLDAEGFAVKIQVKPPRRAVAPAYAVKCQLFSKVAMRLSRVTVTEPVLFGYGHVQNGRPEISEGHVEAAAVERDDHIEFPRGFPELGEQFRFIRAGNKFYRRNVVELLVKIFRQEERLAPARFGVEHGDADDLRRKRPQVAHLPQFRPAGFASGFIRNFFAFAKEIFLLRLVEVIQRQGGGFNVKYKRGHEELTTKWQASAKFYFQYLLWQRTAQRAVHHHGQCPDAPGTKPDAAFALRIASTVV